MPEEWKDYDAIIGEPTVLYRPKLVKFIKHGKLAMIRNYKEIFNSKQTIRFQFDMFHGNGNLDKAIKLLPEEDKMNLASLLEIILHLIKETCL